MDEAAAERALDRLVAAGLVEERDGEVVATRRWAARLQAAAEKVNLVAARTGVAPAGNPLVLAVTQALASENLVFEGAAFDDAVRVLVTLELARMTPQKRSQMGFGDVTL